MSWNSNTLGSNQELARSDTFKEIADIYSACIKEHLFLVAEAGKKEM